MYCINEVRLAHMGNPLPAKENRTGPPPGFPRRIGSSRGEIPGRQTHNLPRPPAEAVQVIAPEHRREVLDFVAFLLLKQKRKQAKPLRQTRAGALRRYRDTCTALDLQKESLAWRI